MFASRHSDHGYCDKHLPIWFFCIPMYLVDILVLYVSSVRQGMGVDEGPRFLFSSALLTLKTASVHQCKIDFAFKSFNYLNFASSRPDYDNFNSARLTQFKLNLLGWNARFCNRVSLQNNINNQEGFASGCHDQIISRGYT
jgi:hypothetical protein